MSHHYNDDDINNYSLVWHVALHIDEAAPNESGDSDCCMQGRVNGARVQNEYSHSRWNVAQVEQHIIPSVESDDQEMLRVQMV